MGLEMTTRGAGISLYATTALFYTLGSVAAGVDATVPMHEKGAATYYVSVSINDKISSDFLVDTGSGYVTINSEILGQLMREQGAVLVKKIAAVMADGSETVVPVYRLASLKLGNSCIIRDVEAAVLPGATRNILGLSALKKAAPFTLSTTPPALALTNCGTGSV
jgi:predicted aspartyl protease